MAIPFASDLYSMGWTYNGEPFIEVDATPNLTSPGHMGVVYNGEPPTFVPSSVIGPPIFVTRTILSRAVIAGPMGIKKPHLP